MNKWLKRRDFLKNSILGGALMGLPVLGVSGSSREEILQKITATPARRGDSVIGLRVDPIKPVKVGLIGIGNRGMGHLRHMASLHGDKTHVTALCDIRPDRTKQAEEYLQEQGIKKTGIYTGNENAWKEMVKRDDLDLVIISTPWKLHAPMCVYSMQQGKHVAVEVPAAITIDECWQIVNTAEETRRNCMMMENVCYGNEELWILNMVNEGVFGTLTYGEAAYIHNLRDSLFGDTYYNKWRIRHHVGRDGNLYPTHGLGPVAQYMNIARGDRFDFVVSMSSPQASLTEHSKEVDPSNEFYNRADFRHGDMNYSIIKTARGRSILVQHDVVTPRPYSRINALAGSKAYHEGYPSRLSIHGKGHEWLDEVEYNKYRQNYNHPIWDSLKEEIKKHGGHGGMDFVMNYRLIDCLNRGLPLDMDVYDAADWSVVTPLSVMSVELGSIPVKFPDFTRGKWKKERLLGMLDSDNL